jgi:protein TonB
MKERLYSREDTMTANGPNIMTLDGRGEVFDGRGRRSGLLPLSLGFHLIVALGFVVMPLLTTDSLPEVSDQGVRGFFADPSTVQAPPPPPPPAPAVAASARRMDAPAVVPAAFVAPIELPQEIEAEDSLAFGLEGGVPGGVAGGVPGGVVGGVIGGLPDAPPAPERTRAVRVGGAIKEPRKLKHVDPAYPDLALRARLEGLVVLEAEIAPNGSVADVRVLRSVAMLDEAAVDAVKRWKYTPTLVDGIPVPALMTVTVRFRLADTSFASLR